MTSPDSLRELAEKVAVWFFQVTDPRQTKCQHLVEQALRTAYRQGQESMRAERDHWIETADLLASSRDRWKAKAKELAKEIRALEPETEGGV